MLKKMPFYKTGKEAQMEELKENKVDYIPMVERAFNIIELLYDSGEGMGVSEIAAQLQLPKATVYRILATMEKWGYIFQDFQTEKYNLGFNFIKVGESVKSTVDARTIALPFMEKLAEERRGTYLRNRERRSFGTLFDGNTIHTAILFCIGTVLNGRFLKRTNKQVCTGKGNAKKNHKHNRNRAGTEQ